MSIFSSPTHTNTQGLIKKYPDINVDQLTALISLREDLAKTNIRKVGHVCTMCDARAF